jgi:serine/threonine protein kinase
MAGVLEKPSLAALASADTLDGTPAVAPHASPSEPPTRIGRYLILRRLGQGGMGVVYSAYDADLDRKVAIKVVRDSLKDSTQERTRVLQEAQAMARLAHPNVVHVYEVGHDPADRESHVFIAMEFVPGLSLTEWVKRQRPSASPAELVRMHLQAAAGLAAAHASGLIHRDFKPDNVSSV